MKFADLVIGLGLGVVPPLAAPETAPVPQTAKAWCICGQSDQCKCESGKCPGGCPVQPYSGPAWYSVGGYADAVTEMDRTGKAVVLLFTDPVGCVPCRQLEAGALSDTGVRAAMSKTINVRVDVRTAEGSRLAGQFGVNSWPRVLVYRENKLLGERAGNVSAADLLQAITR